MTQSKLNPDEEKRVIALEFASKLLDYQVPIDTGDYLAKAATIEAYIKDGKQDDAG